MNVLLVCTHAIIPPNALTKTEDIIASVNQLIIQSKFVPTIAFIIILNILMVMNGLLIKTLVRSVPAIKV
jgi:hypothetical protein